MKKKGFDIVISSDTQYDDLCAEIYFDQQFVAILTQEEGIENAMIEISPPKNTKNWTFNYFEFITILDEAENNLKRLKKHESSK